MQNAAHCTFGRSFAAADRKAPREEEWESCETSRADKCAEGMMALHNAGRSVSVLAPPPPRAFQSTYLGPPGNLKLARAILGPPLLHPASCDGKLFFRDLQADRRICVSKLTATARFWESARKVHPEMVLRSEAR